jgi:RNA polymerase sigma-70 factor (ECF subfamily)
MREGGSDAEVYAACASQLVRFATGLVGPSDAPDVVSEAVVQVMNAEVWVDAENKRALLFRSVLLQAKTWRRAEGRRLRRQAHAFTPEAMPPTDVDHDDVHSALSALSHQQRAVVFLTYWHDLDPAGVAALLGVSEGSVRKQLARARAQLRKVLT